MSVRRLMSRIAEDCAAASLRPDAIWMQGICFLAAVALAWGAAAVLARPGGGLEEARRLGIIGAATLAGYPTDRDLKAYAIALAVTLVAGTGLWIAWSATTRGRGRRDPVTTDASGEAGWSGREIVVLAGVLLLGLLRFDLATNGWDAPFTFYAEEGEALAWAQVVLHGGVLSRDVYCAYGPLFTWAVVLALKLAGPTVLTWRLALYLLDVPALLAVYAVLRELGRSRWIAAAGTALVLFHRMWPMPAMSWSLLRTGFGIAAIVAVSRFLRRRDAVSLLAAGAAIGCGVFYSQEAGTATAIAVIGALLLDRAFSERPWGRFARDLAALAVGFCAVSLPILAWYAMQGALGSLIVNLVGFARLRTLGHGATPFPHLLRDVHAWLAAPGDATAQSLRETFAIYFGPAVCALATYRVALTMVGRTVARETVVAAALAIYGAVLFTSPLSRPDATHVAFAIPPAFILATDLLARASSGMRGEAAALGRRSACAAAVVVLAGGLACIPSDLAENVGIFARQVGLNVTLRGRGTAEPGFRTLDLPRAGGIRIPADRADEIEDALRYALEETAPDEALWAAPNEPMLNFLADRPFSNPFPNAFFAITAAQRAGMVEDIERSGARLAVVNEKPSLIDGIPSRTLSPEIWAELEARFVPDRRFGRLAVYRRSDAPEIPPAR